MKTKQNYRIPNYDLTKRETEVLNLLYQGFSREDIAEKLFISKNTTLKDHIFAIYQKKQVHTMGQLLALRIKELEKMLKINEV